jgi:hypothetical protein
MHPRATIVTKNQKRAVRASKTKLFSGKQIFFSGSGASRFAPQTNSPAQRTVDREKQAFIAWKRALESDAQALLSLD